METQADRSHLFILQRNEITEYHIYTRLAQTMKTAENRRILEQVAADELRHYQYWRQRTGQEVKPSWLKVWFYCLLGRLLGFTFALKLMERGETGAHARYGEMGQTETEVAAIAEDEGAHEEALLALLDEERLRYTGSIVLGLNDALVELTGALAGLTLALRHTQLIAMTGLITGIAAALSMSASEYLSTQAEADSAREPVKASIYTGVAYIFAVFVLILPYLLIRNYYVCLAVALVGALLIIAGFNYYISVARDVPFRRRFLEMTLLSLSVAALSFLIGFVLRTVFGIEA